MRLLFNLDENNPCERTEEDWRGSYENLEAVMGEV